MKEYPSPYNPKVTIFPPDPKKAKRVQEQEEKRVQLNATLAEIYQILPEIDTRINELENVIQALGDRINDLKKEKAKAETRKDELEKLWREY